MLKLQTKKQKGFTLVELIVVIAILAVLAASAVIAYSNISNDARISALQSDGETICRVLNTYNSLAKTPLTTAVNVSVPATCTIAGKNASDFATLGTTIANGDMVALTLAINITQPRLNAVLTEPKLSITHNGTMWIVTRS